MATHDTDFREYRRGRFPSDFEELWTAGSVSIVDIICYTQAIHLLKFVSQI